MADEPLPEAVARVAGFLEDAGAEARLQEFEEGTGTAEAAANAIGCDLDQIVKSLLFICDGSFVLVMVPGTKRADSELVRRATGAQGARIARPEVVEKATGFPVGGVAPFPLPGIPTALLDESLLRHELVWIGAGSRRHMAGLAPHELLRLARARAAAVSAD